MDCDNSHLNKRGIALNVKRGDQACPHIHDALAVDFSQITLKHVVLDSKMSLFTG